MRVYRPKTVKLDGEKYEVHIDQTVYVHRGGLRRVVVLEIGRLVPLVERADRAPTLSPEHEAREVRRVEDHELCRRVVEELRRLTAPPAPPREPSDEEVKQAAMEMDDPAMRFRSRVR